MQRLDKLERRVGEAQVRSWQGGERVVRQIGAVAQLLRHLLVDLFGNGEQTLRQFARHQLSRVLFHRQSFSGLPPPLGLRLGRGVPSPPHGG